MPMGCFADDGSRLDIQGTFKTRGYVLQCILDHTGDLSFKYKSCLSDTQEEFGPNESWQDDRYWYICTVNGDHLRPEVGGCVHEGRRFGIGGTVEKKGFLYECKRYVNKTSSLCPVACMHQGKRYDIEQTFEMGKYWYTCTLYQGRIAKMCVGCLHKEKRLMDGDRYFQRDSVFECEVRNNSAPEHRLIGCRDVEDGVTIERRLGCVWTVGRFPTEYLMQCVPQHGRGAVKRVIKCYFKNYELAPGCLRLIDDELVVCSQSKPSVHGDSDEGDSGTMTIERYDPAVHLQRLLNAGMQYCAGDAAGLYDTGSRHTASSYK